MIDIEVYRARVGQFCPGKIARSVDQCYGRRFVLDGGSIDNKFGEGVGLTLGYLVYIYTIYYYLLFLYHVFCLIHGTIVIIRF